PPRNVGISTTVRFAPSIEVTRATTRSSDRPSGTSSFGIRTPAGMSTKRPESPRRPISRSISASSEGMRVRLKGRRHLRVLKGQVLHADPEPYLRKSEMSRRPEPASTSAAAPNPIEFLYASDGRSPFSDAVTSENSMPWPATTTVWPSFDLAMLSRQRVPRTAACANDSLLGGMKSWSAHAFFSSAAYSGCGIPDSSADHSLRHGRLDKESPNASARMMALSMLRRNGLAKIAAGRPTGHAPARLRSCSLSLRESSARAGWISAVTCIVLSRTPPDLSVLPRQRTSEQLSETSVSGGLAAQVA